MTDYYIMLDHVPLPTYFRPWIKETEEALFFALMTVVDVLAEIHNIDLTVREETKKLFVKQ